MKRVSQSPTDPAFVQDPYPFYERARAEGDAVVWDEYGMPVALSHAAAMAVLKDKRLGRAPLTPRYISDHLADFAALDAHSMLELEPPAHTRLRGLVLRAFTSRRVAALAPEIEALCHGLIDRFPDRPFDLLPAYAQRVPVIVIARLLGVPDDMADDLLAWSNAMVAMYQARRTREVEDAANNAARDFAAFLAGYIEKRRTSPADDLITHLIAAETEGERLTTAELVSTCILLLNAGHEATVHTIGNGVKAVLEHGRSAEVASDTEALVEEIVRYDPPLHLFTRFAYEDCEVADIPLRRGDEVGALLAAANRDPAVWDRPAAFDPLRPAAAHTSFGAGIHFCVGAPLARLELGIALRVLFSRCPRLAIAEPPRYANLYHFHGLESLMVAAR